MAEVKTAQMLAEWLVRVIGKQIPPGIVGVAHGGTSLTLQGIKDSTKDVDFAFLDRAAFDAVRAALLKARYRMTSDFRPVPDETFQRFENPAETIDTADIRHPTWNSWTMAGLALAGCLREPHGNLDLLLPDIETSTVFKMYPCRASDLDDLRDIIRKGRPKWDRVKRIAEEQDAFAAKSEGYSGALVIAKRRARAYASVGTLVAAGITEANEILPWAERRWKFLRLDNATPVELLSSIRAEDMAWERSLSDRENEIALILGIEVAE